MKHFIIATLSVGFSIAGYYMFSSTAVKFTLAEILMFVYVLKISLDTEDILKLTNKKGKK